MRTIQGAVLFSILILILKWNVGIAQPPNFTTNEFLYGASVYPEFQTKEEQIKMLDLFQQSGLNLLRVAESSWGNLETASRKFNFGWLRFFLDEMHKRNMKAMLGTSSYIVPQWLSAKHPEILWQYEGGGRSHSMARHAVSRDHPLFRSELKKYLIALGGEFKDHPAVIGWQLDNEIEANIYNRIDYNPSNKKLWTEWLKKEYQTADELNRRMDLRAWGLNVSAIDDVHLPGFSNEGGLPVLYLANLRFQGDNVMDYFRWQKSILLSAGVKDWITTDLMMVKHTLADRNDANNPIDIMGINIYQPTEDNIGWWRSEAAFLNLHRSFNGTNQFYVSETRIGPTGSEMISNAAAWHRQFVTWMIQPAAFGAKGLMHWSGNRFNGGHWPHWGGMLDWSGNPEPDFKWVTEIAALYKKWGNRIVNTNVHATAAVFTDYDQRAVLLTYPHIPSATGHDLWTEAFDAFQRNGIGVDALNALRTKDYENLKKYQTIVIGAAPAFDGKTLSSPLKKFVENGGTLIVAPLTGYQTGDGVFRSDGFASDLTNLTGVVVRTVRLLGAPSGKDAKNKIEWNGQWHDGTDLPGLDGLTEILEVQPDVQVIARFSTGEEIMNNKPAATIRTIGKGNVIKLAFWPADNSFTQLIGSLTLKTNRYLQQTLLPGLQAVPRTDSSLFIINPMSYAIDVSLKETMTDRLTGSKRGGDFKIEAYETLWLE